MKLVLSACKLQLDNDDIQYIYNTVNEGFNYSNFLYYCIHNRVAPLVWRNFSILDLSNKLEGNIKRAFISIYEYIKHKNIILYKEINRVNTAFEQKKIKAILLKGAILAPIIYGDIALREFGDVDYLVQYEDIKKVEETLADLGYIQGKYSSTQNKVIPASRVEIIHKKKHTHELVEFLKIDDNNPDIVHMIDINHAIFWKGRKNKFSFDTVKIFENANRIKLMDSYVYNMDIESQLIQLCAHLYSEAVFFLWDEHWIRNKAEVSLYRFCDIYEIIKKEKIDWKRFRELVEQNNVEEPVEYCFSCINILFGNCVEQSILKKTSPDLINKYYDLNDHERFWNNNIFDRLFDINNKHVEVD